MNNFGKIAEQKAVEYLKSKGFKIVEENFFAKKYGEIDIIAIKDNIFHFIEVKASKKEFEPIYNITPKKLNKIINSIDYYLTLKNISNSFSVDAVLIHKNRIEFLENITI